MKTLGKLTFCAAAVAACRSRAPVVIDDDSVVAKSYPGFWDDFDALAPVSR